MPVDNRTNMSTMEKTQKHFTSRIEKLKKFLRQGLKDIKSEISPVGGDQGNLVDSKNDFENKFYDLINALN